MLKVLVLLLRAEEFGEPARGLLTSAPSHSRNQLHQSRPQGHVSMSWEHVSMASEAVETIKPMKGWEVQEERTEGRHKEK